MADLEKIFEVVNCLPLQDLNDDWVKNVWESEFTEVDITDDISQNVNELIQAFQLLRSELTQWTSKKDNEVLWVNLLKKNVSVESILAYIAHLIVTGNKPSASVDKRILGCVAAQVYTKLLLAPGSTAYKVFHPELYEKSNDYLKQYFILGSAGGSKRKSKSPFKSSQSKKKGAKRRKKQDESHEEEENEDPLQTTGNDDDLSDEDNALEMTPQMIKTIRNSLHALLVDIVTLLESFPLKQNLLSMRHTVQIFTNLTRLDIEMFDGNFSSRVPFRLKCTPALAFKGLTFLCSQLHGQMGAMMNSTCKGLLPSLLMLVENKPVQTVNKQLQLIQEHAVNFVCFLLQECGERAETSVRYLLYNMCTKVTDRAEYRTKVSATVVKVAQQLSDESYCKMIQWLYKLSKSSEINNRVFAIEVVSTLLSCPERQVTNTIAPELLPYLSHRSHLGILIDRCSDKAPTVRARAIACFGHCLGSKDEIIASTVMEIMTPQEAVRPGYRPKLIRTPGPQNMADTVVVEDTTIRPEVTLAQEGSTIATEKTSDRPAEESPLQKVAFTPGFDPNLTDSEGLFSMLRRRAKDDKLVVRKAAVQALENAIKFEAPNLTEQNVEVLSGHCLDPALSVRKQAMQSLTEILMEMSLNRIVQKHWLSGVLPLVLDRESTLSDKCFEILEDLLLNNVVLKVRSTSESHTLAWSLLTIIAQPPNEDKRRYLQKACHHWSRQGKIKSSLISALETHIGTDNNKAAWMLLAQIAPAAPKIGHSLLMNYWKQPDQSVEIMGQALTVTRHFLKHLPPEDRQWLMDILKSRLQEFSSPPELISMTVSTLSKMYDIQNPDVRRKSKQPKDWCHELLAASDLYLSKVILQGTSSEYDEELVICHLFTLGEVVQFCPASVPKRIILLVQSMIATPCIASLPAGQSQPSSQNDHSKSSETSSNAENRCDGDSLNSSGESGGSQDLQGSQGSQGSQFTQTSQSSQPLTQFRGSIMSQRVRAFAIISLGKLCLQHDGLAKKCIPAIARELEISTDPTIRNNVMIVMCDLCVRYPTTANNYISKISSVLKDQSPLLRKQTVTQIARLIQEDFLKWKGALFYQFISTLLDECDEIKEFIEYFLIHKLLPRFPNLLYQHFIECIFHFNDFTTHTIYNQFPQTEKDREGFSLKGDKNMKKREELYKFLLDSMTDEHRFQIQSKICQEILGAIVDGIMPFDNSTKDLLRDSLKILSCKEIKLTILRSQAHDEIATDEQEMAAVVVAVAKKTIITQVLKKNVMENVMPTVIALKHMMEKERSPMLTHIMMYLRELMKDYKKEVKEILEMDKQLAAEIEYDLRKFDEEQARKQANIVEQAKGSPVVVSSPVAGQGSSRTGSPARASPVGTPKGPVMRDNAGSPAGRSPHRSPSSVLQLKWPNTGTPYRVAMMNSALKRMEGGPDKATGSPRMALYTEKGPDVATGSPTMSNHTENSSEQVSGSPRLSVINESGSDKVTGSRRLSVNTEGNNSSAHDGADSGSETPQVTTRTCRKVYRAISTPSVAMGNITFQGEGNMTFLPPSPISERTSIERVYDESENDKENEENPLLVNSPQLNEKPTKPSQEDGAIKLTVTEADKEKLTQQETRKSRRRKSKT